jgi:predicted nucleic acid-binding protein
MVIYWDASAILSVLVEDKHSSKAQNCINKRGVHLLSTLADAETYAVLNRMKHEKSLTSILYESALEVFHNSPLRKINIQPEWKEIQKISSRHVLKGADLWHLATVESIRRELPEVKIITFDSNLSGASKKEKLLVK